MLPTDEFLSFEVNYYVSHKLYIYEYIYLHKNKMQTKQKKWKKI